MQNLINLPKNGYFDPKSRYWIIRNKDDWEFDKKRKFLIFGGPGVDGLEFGIRQDLEGIWVYYYIDNEFVKIAESVADLIEGWTTGRISV